MRLLKTAVSAIAAEVGRDEVLLVTGLALLVLGLWPIVGWASLIVPGGAFTWLALPSRAPFVKSEAGGPPPARRN